MIKGPPEFSKKSWRPPWIFSAASHLYLWSEKSPPENTKAMESAPLNLWRHFLSPPENEKAILMPPWILRRKTERRIHSKTAIFNRSIQGGLAHQKCYARVQPGYSVTSQATVKVIILWKLSFSISSILRKTSLSLSNCAFFRGPGGKDVIARVKEGAKVSLQRCYCTFREWSTEYGILKKLEDTTFTF